MDANIYLKTIWKFPLEERVHQFIEMPVKSKILCVGHQDSGIDRGRMFLWAEVNPSEQKYFREFLILGTGHPIDAELNKEYLGTVFMDKFVFHVFECLPKQ